MEALKASLLAMELKQDLLFSGSDQVSVSLKYIMCRITPD